MHFARLWLELNFWSDHAWISAKFGVDHQMSKLDFCSVNCRRSLEISVTCAALGNQIVQQLVKLFGIKWHISTPHSHQSIGGVERLNQTIQRTLLKMLEGAINTWDVLLPYITHIYNTTTHSVTKSTPFSLMLKRATNGDEVLENSEKSFNMQEWLDHQADVLGMIYPEIIELRTNAQARMAKQFSKTHVIIPELHCVVIQACLGEPQALPGFGACLMH